MANSGKRPLSPHLTIYKWGPHMTASILNRFMGVGLATVGTLGFVWWLMAAASGPEAYATFLSVATGWFGKIIAIGLTFAFFFHLFGGLRHFVMDAGAGFELKANRTWAMIVMGGAALVTLILWLFIFFGKA